ncbi:MAG TPA: hypothetical protein VG500_04615 [Gemmatimonadales bacterium]|jgi:hypothetical protein|nr:hypothetical protein [Gemmatimonadales bacterium]
MRHSAGTRTLALVAGLLVAATGAAYAQDTTETGAAVIDTTAPEAGAIDTAGVDTASTGTDTSATRDTTDTSGVQNPPGYRGMERDTTMFPDSGGPPASPEQVQGAATGVYQDSAAGGDSTTVGDTEPKEETSATPRIDPTESGGDTTSQTPDSTQ